jgi:uncharacterized membrane protein
MKLKMDYIEEKTNKPGITQCTLSVTIGVSKLTVAYSTDNGQAIPAFRHAFSQMNDLVQREGGKVS